MRGLGKRFGDLIAVRGIDLDVPRGSFFGLVGPNGAGKTTTLSMVTGLLRPDNGQAFVLGHDVWADPVAAKRLLGVLPDGLKLFDRLTGLQLITYAGLLRGMPRELATERAAELIAALGLGRGTGQARRRLLGRHDEEGHARVRARARAEGARARRALRGGRPRSRPPRSGASSRTTSLPAARWCSRATSWTSCSGCAATSPSSPTGRCWRVGTIDEVRGGAHPRGALRRPRRRQHRGGGAVVVAHLLRLKLLLLRNLFRRSRAQTIGIIAGIIYFSFAVVGVALLARRPARPRLDDARVVIPLVGAATIVLWTIVPLFTFGSDPTLDPARFATFAVPDARPRCRARSVGPHRPARDRHRGHHGRRLRRLDDDARVSVGRPALCVVIGLLTAVTTSRWVSARATGALQSRRGRDALGIVALLLLVVVAPLVALVGRHRR